MGTNASKIASKAKECAYPYGTKRAVYTYPTGNPKPEYKKALQVAYGDRKGWGKQTKAGASCDVFSGTVIRSCGYDKNFPRGLDEQIPYVKKHTDKWTRFLPKSKADLKAGDVIIYTKKGGGGHICIYVGNDRVCEAGYKTKRYGCTTKLRSEYYTPSKYKNYKFFGVYRAKESEPKMKKVLDISNYQGVVAESTFKSMKKNGIDMVIIRCSYTHRDNPFQMDKDKSFEKNIVNAYKAGMKIGVYHYSQAISTKEAIAEAEYVLSIIKRHKSKITLPVVFDCEFGKRFNATRAKGIGKTGMLDICNFFCKTVEKAGFKSMVYANLNTLNNYISAQLPEQRRVWVAQYPYGYKETNDVPVSELDYKKPYYMWQFTSSGRVQGVGGHVDLSYFKGSEPKPHTPTTYKGTFPTLPKRGWFQKGDKGTQVKNLQKLLLWLGYSVGKAGADGEYGKDTASAVLAFEKDYKLKYKDGEWGKECQAKAKAVKR